MDKIEVVEPRRPDVELQHVEDSKKWAELKLEAERAESFQRGLGLIPSLKIYRAVCLPSLQTPCNPLTKTGMLLVDPRLRMHHHGILRHGPTRELVCVTSFCAKGTAL